MLQTIVNSWARRESPNTGSSGQRLRRSSFGSGLRYTQPSAQPRRGLPELRDNRERVSPVPPLGLSPSGMLREAKPLAP
jgi:hypothetical protein